jgi:glycyl-tRNA synthetase (class II)
MGYSTGHWDGDTLVVETEGFNDRTWLDMSGHSHGEMLHLTERYHRTDYGHMDVEMTFNDPEFYTKPFSIKFRHQLVPDSDILETYCNENEKDRQHIQGIHEIPAH